MMDGGMMGGMMGGNTWGPGGMMGGYGYGALGPIGLLLQLAFWILIIVGVIFVAKWLIDQGRPASTSGGSALETIRISAWGLVHAPRWRMPAEDLNDLVEYIKKP